MLESVLHIGFSQPPLERAFAKEASVYKFIQWTDYQKNLPELRRLCIEACREIKPTLIFMQIQTPGIIDEETVVKMRQACQEK